MFIYSSVFFSLSCFLELHVSVDIVSLIFAVTHCVTCLRLAISLTVISTIFSFSFLILFLLMSFHMSDSQMAPRLTCLFINFFTWILIWNDLPISWIPPPFGSSKYPESYFLHTVIWMTNCPSFYYLMISKITCGPAGWDYLPRRLSPWMFRAAHPMHHLPLNIELPIVNRILLVLKLCIHASKPSTHRVFFYSGWAFMFWSFITKGMVS